MTPKFKVGDSVNVELLDPRDPKTYAAKVYRLLSKKDGSVRYSVKKPCGTVISNYPESWLSAAVNPNTKLAVLPNKVVTLDGLMAAAYDRKSVIVPKYLGNRPQPAAWIVNLQGALIHRLIGYGMWIYTPKKKRVS